MSGTKDISTIEHTVWNTGNKYRGTFDSDSIVTIWSDMIYLYTMSQEYEVLLKEPTTSLKSLTKQFRNIAKSDETQSAVVNELDEAIRHTLLPRTIDDNRLQIFNEIREDGLALIHQDCERITLMKILQKMNIDFGPRSNGVSSTPDQVNDLMARISGTKKNGKKQVTVYDPTAGSGGSLLAMRQQLDKSIQVSLLGHELNTQSFVHACMMLDLIKDQTTTHDLRNNDALNTVTDFDNLNADIVIADPPYSLKWNPDNGLLKSPQYSKVGVLPPKSKADFAFVLHGLFHLNDDGIMVIQLPYGVLFRGAAEAKIRRYLVEENYVDAVIGLPANLQYETAIPTMLLVLQKNRARKDILFIDASTEVEKSRPNNILPQKSVDKIVQTYQEYSDVKRYAHVADLSQIQDNDFNLNIPRYIDNFTPPETVSIAKLNKQLGNLSSEILALRTQTQDIMAKYQNEKSNKP